jgi:inhibitor of KinA sporulation pathway (predicted exonuclease)
MNYVVFDLEWNQCPDGKDRENPMIPFEIIEIGAVKLNSDRKVVDTFQEYIKPKVYKWLHNRTKELLHMEYKELRDSGQPFVDVVGEFFRWCGPECSFCTWGNQDLMELQRNMKYHGILNWLPGPVCYYDVQKLFSICREDGKSRKSLEYAIDLLHLQKDMEFHRALADAKYTAEIFQLLDQQEVLENFSIDTFQNPQSKKDEIYISYAGYDKFVSREFMDKDKALKDREVTSTRCPKCHRAAKRKVKWFTNNSKNYYSVSLCPEHGLLKGKIRMKRTDHETVYAIKTLRLVDWEEAAAIQLKQESLRKKRLIKKRNLKEA